MKIASKRAKYRHLLMLLLAMPMFLNAQSDLSKNITVAAERPGAYLPLLYGKRVGVVANQTSMVGKQHLVDFLLSNEVGVKKVFAPEHGFRGEASAGETIKDGKDAKTGLPVISLYGKNKKPTAQQLADLDVLLYDIQDVGVRFYTYISTLSYVMEAAAESNKKVVVLDRPNPNGYYVDGPVLQPEYRSFVGLHPIPVVHGLTMGEYAAMVNGEGWLARGVQCDLEVVKCSNYDHSREYQLPVKPSPNLPNELAVALYPSLALFEGTNVSVGRGTDLPFQQVGAPWFTDSNTYFIPSDRPGAMNPPYEGEKCLGFNLQEFARYYLHGFGELYLFWLQQAYKMAPSKDDFFNSYFNLLAGNKELQEQIKAGVALDDIRKSWEPELLKYKLLREKYLLYP